MGLLLCQWAQALGAHVIGTVVERRKRPSDALRAGAERAIVYTREDFVAKCLRLTGRPGRRRGL